MWGIVADTFRYSNKYSASIPSSESLYYFFKSKLLKRLPEKEADHEKTRNMIFQMCRMLVAFVSSTTERQSLKFFRLEETIEGCILDNTYTMSFHFQIPSQTLLLSIQEQFKKEPSKTIYEIALNKYLSFHHLLNLRNIRGERG